MMRYLLPLTFLMSSPSVFADVGSDLDHFFNGIGYASNTTKLQAFESQASGFFGGGSLYTRTPVRQYELVTLDMPDYRAGCAGIDLFTGSLSYISGDKLTNLGKQIMTNGGAYAVDVMLATTVPELKQVRDFLQTTVQKINQSSINSCEMAQNLVGGVWPKTVASQEKVCNDQRRMGQQGLGHDYVSAHMACAGDGFHEAIESASKDDKRKKEVVINKNLIWAILKENAFLNSDTELSELVMSLTGTVIIDKDAKVTEVPSMANQTGLIHALLGTPGSHESTIWRCDEESLCLHVHQGSITISEAHSLSGRIRSMIESINQKLKDDTKLNPAETGFLEMTSLPVMKFLLVLNSTHYGNAAVDMESYATLIASDLLQQYLSSLLQSVSTTLQASALNEDLLKQLRLRVDKANQAIARIEPNIDRKLNEKLLLIQHVARIEKQLSASMQ
jgi:conjugative transfer pilus assembly protein TraH